MNACGMKTWKFMKSVLSWFERGSTEGTDKLHDSSNYYFGQLGMMQMEYDVSSEHKQYLVIIPIIND